MDRRFLQIACLSAAALLAMPATADGVFGDVRPDYWAANFIEQLYGEGITSGCGDGSFCPDQPVTRAQMAVFLERGMNGSDFVPPAASGDVFLDVGPGDFAANFIEQLYGDGITSGCGDGNFCPDQPVTRAEMAVFLVRAFFLEPTNKEPDDKHQFKWDTVINNNDLIPPLLTRNFNSYNQPSVNTHGVVVIRARSRGGPPLGPATHGIYLRDMSHPDNEVIRILDRTTLVPGPNNLGATFTETPSFPRIDKQWPVIATRGNHQPMHRYELDDGSETRAGTTGIYTNPFGDLMMGEANFGHAPGQGQFGVPEFSGQRFEVFPGAPSITGGDTIVFKGNYTVDDSSRTGVYFRTLVPGPSGGDAPAILIANNTDTLIPGTLTTFGSTAPPNAAGGEVVFAGFDDEDNPSLGGIYLAPLGFQPPLTTLVGIGEQVPGAAPEATFNDLGEAISFDGRHVGFWGAWGEETRTVRLYCQEEGNKDRIAYCNQALYCEATGTMMGDPGSICDDATDPHFGERCYTERQVPANQGIFIHDSRTGDTRLVATNTDRFDDFLFWNYSGKPPCSSHGHSEEGDLSASHSIKWRSSAFLAVSGTPGMKYLVAFKARSGELVDGVYVDPVDGIYLIKGPGKPDLVTALDTTMDGPLLDPEAPAGTTVLELGLEREGLRGNWLAVTATMGVEGGEEEEDGMAGVYITRVRR